MLVDGSFAFGVVEVVLFGSTSFSILGSSSFPKIVTFASHTPLSSRSSSDSSFVLFVTFTTHSPALSTSVPSSFDSVSLKFILSQSYFASSSSSSSSIMGLSQAGPKQNENSLNGATFPYSKYATVVAPYDNVRNPFSLPVIPSRPLSDNVKLHISTSLRIQDRSILNNPAG